VPAALRGSWQLLQPLRLCWLKAWLLLLPRPLQLLQDLPVCRLLPVLSLLLLQPCCLVQCCLLQQQLLSHHYCCDCC
jgi:hypothetical protein